MIQAIVVDGRLEIFRFTKLVSVLFHRFFNLRIDLIQNGCVFNQIWHLVINELIKKLRWLLSISNLKCRPDSSEKTLFFTMLCDHSLRVVRLEVAEVRVSRDAGSEQILLLLLKFRIDEVEHSCDLLSVWISLWEGNIVQNIAKRGRIDLEMFGPE